MVDVRVPSLGLRVVEVFSGLRLSISYVFSWPGFGDGKLPYGREAKLHFSGSVFAAGHYRALEKATCFHRFEEPLGSVLLCSVEPHRCRARKCIPALGF